MKLIRFVQKHFRSLFFSGVLTVGFYILIYIHTFDPIKFFWVAAAILYMVLVLEVTSVKFWAKKKLMQYSIPMVNRYTYIAQQILHIVLPSLTYWSIISFIYFEPNPGMWIPFLFMIFLLFWGLFTNVRAYYEDKFKLESKTHYIYDLLKLLVYWLLSFGIFNVHYAYNVPILIISFFIFLFSAILLMLSYVRTSLHEYKPEDVIYVFINASVIAIISGLLLMSSSVNSIKSTFFSFILYYLAVGIMHHKQRRDLTKEILMEYILIAALVLAMFMVAI